MPLQSKREVVPKYVEFYHTSYALHPSPVVRPRTGKREQVGGRSDKCLASTVPGEMCGGVE